MDGKATKVEGFEESLRTFEIFLTAVLRMNGAERLTDWKSRDRDRKR
jgi:hypothetical protein